MNRRNVLKSSAVLAGSLLVSSKAIAQEKKNHNFTFCLNTSTIMKQKIGLVEEIKLAAAVGYDGIEIWMRTLQEYVDNGGKLADIKKLANDLNIRIEDSIGFAKWVVDDETERKAAMEQLKVEMDMLSQIGCKRIAAPPFGATKVPGLNLKEAADRFALVAELGKQMGVLPQLELWGFSANLHLFGETLFVAAESGSPSAVILPDVYHLYRGGSPFESLEMINGSKIEMFHMNDYPAGKERESVTDAMRVMPGDGAAPMDRILQILNAKGREIVLSLEIFNEEYWAMDAKKTAEIGLAKMKASVTRAIK
ncbi:Sugar phosphate isomerase/epimerase [Spirosomataceae bacterium TFI 002]|nr:Sugar phosphate isomerase/epimerase [Spirosomataceae bacterium TFI 002]